MGYVSFPLNLYIVILTLKGNKKQENWQKYLVMYLKYMVFVSYMRTFPVLKKCIMRLAAYRLTLAFILSSCRESLLQGLDALTFISWKAADCDCMENYFCRRENIYPFLKHNTPSMLTSHMVRFFRTENKILTILMVISFLEHLLCSKSCNRI